METEGELGLSCVIVGSSTMRVPEGVRKTGPNPTDRRKRTTKHHLVDPGCASPGPRQDSFCFRYNFYSQNDPGVSLF